MSSAIAPIRQENLTFRLGTMDDLPFMDGLQKKYGKALGHFPFAQYEGYVKLNAVLIAEANGQRIGYIISRDRYLKRDELGVVFQLCVAPGAERKYVGAALVREAFERSAYGCRLYCLWCAQDLDANYFWESLGFVPLAFRAGSDRKKRVHIFWQKRICDGDTGQGATKWWYPFQTTGGAIRADRIVFPIPEGVHWKDVQAVAIPSQNQIQDSPRSHGDTEPRPRSKRGSVSQCFRGQAKPALKPMGGFKFQSEVVPVIEKKAKKPKALPAKIDPKYLAAARELRDRYLEHVNAAEGLLASEGKYDVVRALPEPPAPAHLFPPHRERMLPAA